VPARPKPSMPERVAAGADSVADSLTGCIGDHGEQGSSKRALLAEASMAKRKGPFCGGAQQNGEGTCRKD
jgi:hypothetical protein